MQIIRFVHEGQPRWGSVNGSDVHLAEGYFDTGFEVGSKVGEIDHVTLLAPVTPRTIVAIGRNFADHAAELGNEVPSVPMVFLKPVSSVIPTGHPIRRPAETSQLEHEAEVAVVFNSTISRVAASDAHRYVAGVTLANDVTARDLQKGPAGITIAKGYDTFCPMGPWVDTSADVASLRIESYVNGSLKQSESLGLMVHSLGKLIEYVSSVMTLAAGDVLLLGTPAGVSTLEPGDVVTVRADGVGEISNRVVDDGVRARALMS